MTKQKNSSSEKGRSAPELRFPEFNDDWERKKIGDITEIKGRIGYRGYTINDIVTKDNGAIALSPSNINFDNSLTLNNSTYISWFKYEESPEIQLKEGYILLVKTGSTFGKSALIRKLDQKATINPQLVVLKPKNVNPIFLASIISQSAVQKRIKETVVGGAIPTLSQESISCFEILISSPKEQQKIASFLTLVDDKLQALKKKKELLEQYKKGVMQKIFPSTGSGNTPEIRFKITNQNGELVEPTEWEKKKGKEIFYSHSNKNHNGDLPVLSASQEFGMVLRDDNGIQIQSSENSIKSYKIVEKGDFVISLRSFQGGIEYSNLKGICSPAYTILKPKIPIVDDFFKYYFKKEDFIERLSKTVVGIRDGKQISYEAFGGLKLLVPSVEEQTKIANFLSAIDEKIKGVAELVEATEQWKKGLLQKMFV